MSGTKRTRLSRTPTLGLITPQVLSLYRYARRRGADLQTRQDAEKDCERALGIKLWDISPFDDFMFRRGEPPEYLRQRGPGAVEDWHHAKDLRQQLEAADRELRRQERAARRAAKAVAEPEPEPEPELEGTSVPSASGPAGARA